MMLPLWRRNKVRFHLIHKTLYIWKENTCNTVCNSKIKEATCPSTREWKNKPWFSHSSENLTQERKKWTGLHLSILINLKNNDEWKKQ